MSQVVIRKGTEEDVSGLLDLIKELAAYEKAANEVEVTVEQLLEDGFGENSIYEFYVAELEKEIKQVKKEMLEAAGNLEFETAAKLRDKLKELEEMALGIAA